MSIFRTVAKSAGLVIGTTLALQLAMVQSVGSSTHKDAKETATYNIYIAGIKAGVLEFAATNDGKAYAASGVVRSTGLIGSVVKVSYHAQSQGAVKNGEFRPASYTEKADTGRRISNAVMNYRRGVPQLMSYTPERKKRPNDVAANTQGGTVDPMTAIYALLRDVPEDELCNKDVQLFDGKRRSQLTLSKPVTKNDLTTCQGEYRRLQGFSEKEMADRTKFPFKIVFKQDDDGIFRVKKFTTRTTFGMASAIRK